jgi:hypothetical protein
MRRGIYLAPFDELADPRVLRPTGPTGAPYDAKEITGARAGIEDSFDLVVETLPGADTGSWKKAGATWVLTAFEPQSRALEVREVIEAGP